MTTTAIALTIGSFALFAAPRATACSYFEQQFETMRFSIDDGDTVPTNLVLHSDYVGEEDGSSWWVLSEAAPQRLTFLPGAGASRLQPSAPLAPSTAYRLVWSPSAQPPTGEDLDPYSDDDTGLPFTTAAADDVEAPAAPLVAHETESVGPSNSSCGFDGGFTWARFFVEPDDDVAVYRLTDDDGEVIDTNIVAFGENDGGDFFLSDRADRGGTVAYDIVAIDHAGNESEPTTVAVALGCPGSCSSADIGSGASLAAVLLLLRRRRRR